MRRLLLSSSKPDPEADEALAKCYLETFQLAQAESVIEKWIHDAPGDVKPHYRRSLVLTRLGGTALAKAEQDTSARLRDEREHIQKLLNEMLAAPGGLDHQYDAARWLFEHGRPEEGLRWTEKILRDQPRHTKTNRLLADYTITRRTEATGSPTSISCKPSPSVSRNESGWSRSESH